jgi:recombination protein RecT
MQDKNYPASQPQNAAPATQKPIDLLKAALNAPKVQEQFQNAMGAHKDAFVASLIDLYVGDKSLQSCKPSALVVEALRAATLHLPLNKSLGFAYIVVYNNNVKSTDPQTGRDVWMKVPTPTFIPGYKGYIQLAMRTGQYRTINADIVYEGELRKVNKLTGEIAFDGEKKSDKVVGYFCYFELLNGFSKTLYVSVEDMAAYAKRYSPSIRKDTTVDTLMAKANDGSVGKQVGWEGNFNDMALKTVIRRLLSKYGYLSVEMVGAMDKDTEETATDQRNDTLAGNANMRPINIEDDADYEEVDAETGEIRKPAAEAKAPAAEDKEEEAPY